jgi:aspartyl-tRNA(Asn)/glutamyl-tRNA(Gln) amidotransferase subunit C
MILYAASIFKPSGPVSDMALKLEDVKRAADLARIAVDDAEARAALSQLNDVFKLIAEMQAVDTRGIEPMSHALDLVQRLRADEVGESDQHAQFQAVAPHVEGDLYLVPKVIE